MTATIVVIATTATTVRPLPAWSTALLRPAYHRLWPAALGPGARYYGDGYGPTYVVNDYRGYGLRAPPRGHYWRRSDAGDYLLVAVATGIITDLILRH